MSYPIETKIAPRNSWFTPQESQNYYGSYARQGVTCHWWGGGESADQHDNIVNYFLAQGAQGTKSVNYVVSDIKITKMVESNNVAWASQSGNPVTISIEFQPTLSAEGYKRGGWLIAELEKTYGPLELYKHSFWFPTACPGTIDLNRLRTEANNFKGEDMNVTQDQLNKICWLATGLQASSNKNFQNNLGNPLDTILDNFMGYSETKSLHLDAEAYRAGQTGTPKVVVNGKEYVPKV